MISHESVRLNIGQLALKRILIIDGAMGAMIQAYRTESGQALSEEDFRGLTGDSPHGDRFRNHPAPLKGCNDLLCLTMPDIISGIHNAYLEAGADIIETCTFNATPVSLAGYGLKDLAYEISFAAASIARKAADAFSTAGKPRYVAGSMGPTSKSASISPDINEPAKRAITWDELEAAYYENARGLLDGGADLLIIETIFDTLNAKAAIFAVKRLADERNRDVPVIISATVSEGGRLLSGQTVEAFCVSVLHANPVAVGLNCSFGAAKLKPYIQTISSIVPCLVIAYPNAGLPDRTGVYEENPELMANHMEDLFREGVVNIAGGCCGSTPAHIAAISERAKNFYPRPLPVFREKTLLSGLEVLEVCRERGLVEIGERTNVAGSVKFREMIMDEDYDSAVDMARDMAEAGASLIDVCMDDAAIDAKAAMTNFLNFSLQFPDLARLPFMIDSSDWNVIEAGLKCLQGKGVVNSISLRDGDEEFLEKIQQIRAYGAAVVIMLIDEEGPAVSYDRRIAVAERSWKLLAMSGFPPEDIIFDPNVLPAATGVNEHNTYTPDFLNTCKWIRDNCKGVQITGGISNLSFFFRGNSAIREAMHAIFIKHAVEYGLSMAIVNPATLVSYDEIDKELRQIIEDLLFNVKTESFSDGAVQTPLDKLLAYAEKYLPGSNSSADTDSNSGAEGSSLAPLEDALDGLAFDERVSRSVIRGIDDFIANDLDNLSDLHQKPLEIIEGPLMDGIKDVGDRFGEGRMFLPQVIRSAMVMKKAFDVLQPRLEKDLHSSAGQKAIKAKVLVATVKGDIHDMGKNLAAMILESSGCEIIDLGVSVPANTIIEKAITQKADVIGLSALITSSLDEMILTAREMENHGFTIPLIVSGAAASLTHTVLRIVPVYSGPVVYIAHAGQAPAAIRSLMSKKERPGFLKKMKEDYAEALANHESFLIFRPLLTLEEARKNKVMLSWSVLPKQSAEDALAGILSAIRGSSPEYQAEMTGNIITLNYYPSERLIPHLDWTSFVQTWDLAVNTYPSAYNRLSRIEEKKVLEILLDNAKVLLKKVIEGGILTLRGVVGFFPAYSEGDDIVLENEGVRFCFPRNQERKIYGSLNPCLSDFILPRELCNVTPNSAGLIGLFALSAGFGLQEAEADYRNRNDDYHALLLAGLANSLAEAFSEEIHSRVKTAWSGDDPMNRDPAKHDFKYRGIRPVFGYPACPDHKDKEIVFKILEAEKRCGLKLTESAMIIPVASVCGMYMAHPDSFYFVTGRLGDDQLEDWANRKGISLEEAGKRLGRY